MTPPRNPEIPVITFDRAVTSYILNTFGMTVRPDGFIVKKDGELARCIDGEPAKIEHFAGIIKTERYGPTIVRDDMIDLIEGVLS